MSSRESFLFIEWYGRPNRPRSLHIWFGRLGFHFLGKPIIEWMRKEVRP